MNPYVFVLYVAIAVVAIGVLVDGISDSSGDTASPKSGRKGHVLELIVKSTDSDFATITHVTPGSDPLDVSQYRRARLPWKKTFQGVRPLQIGFNLNALQSGTGVLTCTIKMDGEVIEQRSARSGSAFVTCSP